MGVSSEIQGTELFYSWTGVTWVYSVVQSILYYVGVALILLALKHISPTQNKVIRSFQVVGSYILQVALFNTTPHVSDYVGALMIMMAVLGIVLEDTISNIRLNKNRCAEV